MLKAHDLIAIALLLMIVAFSSPIMAAPGDCLKSLNCGVTLREVSEYPAGQVDGNNQAFVLSVVPATAESVRLFLNDHELSRGEDFQVTGRTVIITPGLVPHQGDTLRASFQSDAASHDSVSIEAPPANEHSLLSTIPMEGGSTAYSMSSGSTSSITRGTPRQDNNVESLILLDRRLVEQRRSYRANSGNTRNSLKVSEATGDLPVISPYSRLLGVESKDDPLGELTHATQVHPLIIGPQLRSISILQQRLDSTNQERDEKSAIGHK